MSNAQQIASAAAWVFLIATLLATIGLSGIVNFRLREAAKHHIPAAYRGRHRDRRQMWSSPVVLMLAAVRRWVLRAGERRKDDAQPRVNSTVDDLDRLQVTA